MIAATLSDFVRISNGLFSGLTERPFFETTTEHLSSLYSRRDSAETFLTAPLLKLPGVERILVRRDRDFIRIWIVIDLPDDALETAIYTKYLERLDQLGDLETDLVALYRMGRDLRTVAPTGARPVDPV